VAGTEVAKAASGDHREQIGQLLDGMADDVLLQLKNGYGRDQESEADNAAVATLKRAGYDPTAMVSLLNKMEKRLKPGAADFSHTHPKTSDRIASIRGAIGNVAPQGANAARQARFTAAMAAARKE
jgi:predicted Zn-dependent protease